MSHEEKIARLSARIAELEGVLRAIADTHRVDRWCADCGATWGTQHVGACPVGRGLAVLDGGAR